MRGKTLWGTWVLAAYLALTPALASAQSYGPQYAPADPQLPIPFGSTRPEDGGLFTSGKVLLIRQTNPLRSQVVAIRGFIPNDQGPPANVQNFNGFVRFDPLQQQFVSPAGTLFGGFPFNDPANGDFIQLNTAQPNQPNTLVGGILLDAGAVAPLGDGNNVLGAFVTITRTNPTGVNFQAGQFVGDGTLALDVDALKQRNSYQAGCEFGVGWRFRDGSAISYNWTYVSEAQYRAGASLLPGNSNFGNLLQNTFLFSFVYNIPPELGGADFKINPNNNSGTPIVNPQTVFGIWNGASIMTLEFRQRFQQHEIVYREPIWETETYRMNGLVGPRFAWIWEKFKWVTTSIGQNLDGTTIEGPQFVGIYSNIVSNRMYGVHAGCEQEWYLGRGFAVHLKTEGALFIDSAKEKAKYETAAKYLGLPSNKQSKREWAFVPELQAEVGLMWYPTEFVQVYAGYSGWAFFNTRASPRPIDFNYATINPRYTSVNRFFDGWNAGVAFTW